MTFIVDIESELQHRYTLPPGQSTLEEVVVVNINIIGNFRVKVANSKPKNKLNI